MRLLEYEAKTLLRAANIPVPKGTIISSSLTPPTLFPLVLKSQVPVGGRGKEGGVVIVESAADYAGAAKTLLSLTVKGYTPSVLLAEEKIAIVNEHYLALMVDRSIGSVRLIAHKTGGIDVENSASADLLRIDIDGSNTETAAKKLASYLGYEQSLVAPLLVHLYETFVGQDAILLEINPLIYTAEGTFVCGDCKMELDDAAAFRHPDWNFEYKPGDANFVILDRNGAVATIANGAGLAMATVDAVAARGTKPANFLDIGGGASTSSVLAAFERIMEFPHVKVIIINIFAGITRCDEVARAIIEAKKQIDALPPLYIRLAGTNFEEAVALLAAENIATMASLEECLVAAKEKINA